MVPANAIGRRGGGREDAERFGGRSWSVSEAAMRGEAKARERSTRSAGSWPEEDGSRTHGAVSTVYLAGSRLPKIAGDDKKMDMVDSGFLYYPPSPVWSAGFCVASRLLLTS